MFNMSNATSCIYIYIYIYRERERDPCLHKYHNFGVQYMRMCLLLVCAVRYFFFHLREICIKKMLR